MSSLLRNFTLFFLLFFSISSVAQEEDKGYRIGFHGAVDQHPIVIANKQNTQGEHWVIGSCFYSTYKNSSMRKGDTYGCHFGMSVFQTDGNDPRYYISVEVATANVKLSVLKDSPLLVRLSNGEVLRLFCSADDEDKIGKLFSAQYGIWQYKIHPMYPIDIEDIEKLQMGIAKIRMEINNEKVDYTFRKYKEDELGDFLYKEYQLITNTLFLQTDFEEGF